MQVYCDTNSFGNANLQTQVQAWWPSSEQWTSNLTLHSGNVALVSLEFTIYPQRALLFRATQKPCCPSKGKKQTQIATFNQNAVYCSAHITSKSFQLLELLLLSPLSSSSLSTFSILKKALKKKKKAHNSICSNNPPICLASIDFTPWSVWQQDCGSFFTFTLVFLMRVNVCMCRCVCVCVCFVFPQQGAKLYLSAQVIYYSASTRSFMTVVTHSLMHCEWTHPTICNTPLCSCEIRRSTLSPSYEFWNWPFFAAMRDKRPLMEKPIALHLIRACGSWGPVIWLPPPQRAIDWWSCQWFICKASPSPHVKIKCPTDRWCLRWSNVYI